jgi:hypothetical protein
MWVRGPGYCQLIWAENRVVCKLKLRSLQVATDNLLEAFDARLAGRKWMRWETRAAARYKLAETTTIKVVYPDYWEGTEGLGVVRGDAIGNLRRRAELMRRPNLSELTSYPDKRKFLKPVFQVNAYAMPDWNEIGFLSDGGGAGFLPGDKDSQRRCPEHPRQAEPSREENRRDPAGRDLCAQPGMRRGSDLPGAH